MLNSRSESEVDDAGHKVLLLGESSVGKSSLIKRYITDQFADETKATIGCDFYEKEVDVNGKKVKLSIWDTAGQERFRGLATSYYKRTKVIILVFDITKKSSFNRIDFWQGEIEKYSDKGVFTVLVGNKSDLVEKREVTKEEAEAVMKKNDYKLYLETSALTNESENIQKVFQFIAENVTQLAPIGGSSRHLTLADGKTPNRIDENGKPKEGGCKC